MLPNDAGPSIAVFVVFVVVVYVYLILWDQYKYDVVITSNKSRMCYVF